MSEPDESPEGTSGEAASTPQGAEAQSPESHSSEVRAMLKAYFRDLDTALAPLPRARRRQLADEIRQYVDDALAEQPPEEAGSPAAVANLLDRVGVPEDLAAAALEEEPARPSLRAWHKGLIAAAGVVALAGAGSGIGLALTSHSTSARTLPGPTVTVVVREPASSSPVPTATPSPAARPTRTPATAPAPAGSQQATTAPVATASPTAASRAVLAPATVPPVSAECTEQLTYDTDGNVSPLTCPDGGVNTVAWADYADGYPAAPQLLALGPYASPTQVYQAMCHDLRDVYETKPLTDHAEQIAEAYYGWKFAGDNPVTDFDTLGCATTATTAAATPSATASAGTPSPHS